MANKDYYGILGIPKGANVDQIKSAYKKLALKWHPDRHANESEEKKKEAEEKFKEIAEAYAVLSDPEKKAKYDRYGSVDGVPEFDFGSFGGFGGFDDFLNFFGGRGSTFNGFGGGGFRPTYEPGATLEVKVPVSIEEIYSGATKVVEYDIKVRCDKCDGEGGTGLMTCPHCHGTGIISETIKNGPNVTYTSQHQCGHCHGAGTTVKNPCKECGGTGFKKQHKTINVTVPRGVQNGYKQKITGAGFESKNPKGVNGDLIIVFVYAFDQNRYRINGNTLYELVNIPYYDAILGCHKDITLPNGEKITAVIPKCSKDSQQVTVPGKGIGYGNYVLVINVTLPTSITEKEKEELEKIKSIHS